MRKWLLLVFLISGMSVRRFDGILWEVPFHKPVVADSAAQALEKVDAILKKEGVVSYEVSDIKKVVE